MTKKVPDITEFKQLREEQQLDILQRDGVYIGKGLVEGRITILMQLYTFYVELHYRQYRSEIIRIITSDHTELLQPYLDQVRIRDLDTNKNEGKDS